MCSECRQEPCLPRCPNADENKDGFIGLCNECEYPIYKREDHYNILGKIYCDDCVNRSAVCGEV